MVGKLGFLVFEIISSNWILNLIITIWLVFCFGSKQIVGLVEQFKERMVNKGKEINEYMEQYNIRPVVDDRSKSGGEDSSEKDEKRPETSSVLVAKDWDCSGNRLNFHNAFWS